MISELLHAFRLTADEMSVFEKTLETGGHSVKSIAKELQLPEGKVKKILATLVKIGVVARVTRDDVEYYDVETKENIIEALKRRKKYIQQQIDEQVNLLESSGDELTFRTQAKSKPKITFYEGVAGLEKAYEDTLTSTETIRSWASFQTLHGSLPEYFETYYQRRAAKKIFIRSIHPDSAFARDRQKNDFKEMRESFLVDPQKYSWIPEIQIYDHKVNIASLQERLAIIIESSEIAQALSNIFDMCLETARRYDEKVQDEEQEKEQKK